MKKLAGSFLLLYSPLVLHCAHADAPATVDSSDANSPPATASGTYPNPSSTSNTSNTNETQRGEEQLGEVLIQADKLSLGGGLMSIQEAPKAVSTISRDAIMKAAPGATYAQMVESIPGMLVITDDVTGLNDANYQLRGFTNDEVGVTVNGAPINDSGNYQQYPSEYGDTENMGDITVQQGYPDVDAAVVGAAGGTIAWATIDPTHNAGIDVALSGGSYGYYRAFTRVQTGDIGPVRSWASYSYNHDNMWRGAGTATADKVDAKSVWTISDNNSVSASLQYNHEFKYRYYTLSKAQANANYFASYDTTLLTPTDTNYWKLHTNPFDSLLFSMDGEFHLLDTLRLSVVPYFQYGNGGGGGGVTFTESAAAANAGRYLYVNYDLDRNGVIGGKVLGYDLSQSITNRPGVIAKFIQQIGHDDSLELGFWFEEPREVQNEPFTATVQGAPVDNWVASNNSLIRYPDGNPQYLYYEYTKTSLRRGFVRDTWTPTDQWTLTAGVAYTSVERQGSDYEYFGATAGPSYQRSFGGPVSRTYDKWTPTAGLKFQLDQQNQFYAGYGRTFRAPINGSILQNAAVTQFYEANPGEISFSKITPAQLAAIGNEQPEVTDTIDLGWRYYGDKLSGVVDLYGSNMKNKQLSGYDEASSQTIYLSVPKLHQRGVNAEGSYKILNPLTLYASYSYTVSKFASDLDSIGDGYYPVNGKSFLDTPKNVAYIRMGYDQGPLWANLAVKYRSSFWGDWMNTEKAGGYTTLDLSAGWRFANVTSWLTKPELKLNVVNLTNKHALSFDSATTLLANKGPIDPRSGTALYAAGAFYNLVEPCTFMLTLSASLF